MQLLVCKSRERSAKSKTNAISGIPGVREHALFLKEVNDAQAIRRRIMDCCETATFKDQDQDEVKRLLHMVVVGGGPTGVEFAGELQDFFISDLQKWIPDIRENFHVTLVEALPNVRPHICRIVTF
jgi:NADH:ubiquinone reductase (non-electrogenic)